MVTPLGNLAAHEVPVCFDFVFGLCLVALQTAIIEKFQSIQAETRFKWFGRKSTHLPVKGVVPPGCDVGGRWRYNP